jgi:hypothetical protein
VGEKMKLRISKNIFYIKNYSAGVFIALIVLGVLPLFSDFLVAHGYLFVPVLINKKIFLVLFYLFYLIDFPLFILCFLLKLNGKYFVVLGALAPFLALIILSIIVPISDVPGEQLANSVIKYCSWFVLAFGAFDGFVIWKVWDFLRNRRESLIT